MKKPLLCLFTILFIVSYDSKAQILPIEKSNSLFSKYKLIQENRLNTINSPLLIRFKRALTLREIEDLQPLRKFSGDHFIMHSNLNIKLKEIIAEQTPVNALWKAGDRLTRLYESESTHTRVHLIKIAFNPRAEDLRNLLNDLQNYSTDQINHVIKAEITLGALKGILAYDAVIFADLSEQAKEEVVVPGLDPGTNEISAVQQRYPRINGLGITLSLKEGMFDQFDIDIAPNIAALPQNSPLATAHATTMATLALGRGNSFIRGKGAAPLARLTSSNFSNLMPDAPETLNQLQVSVQNHSYGTDLDPVYGIEAEAYDRQIAEADTLVHVFSSGNKGTTTPVNGVYSGIPNTANLTGNFKQAKNVLVVGGINRANTPEALSSRGPAYDGRIKPELVALGEDGTSGAAALTSGTVALLQQEYKTRYGKQPAAALVKSILVNAADDIGAPHADFITGFGKLNALESVQTLIDKRFVTAAVAQGEEYVFPLQVAAGQKEIKVTLAWTDPPAPVNSPLAIVNHLDVSLETPSGNLIRPWVLSSYPNADSLSKPSIRQMDDLNTIQQLTLEDAAAGNYVIHVKGRKVIQGQQAFALAYQLKPANDFSWTYPENNEALFAGEENYLRWSASFGFRPARLSVSYTNGTTWNVISNSIKLDSNYFRWNTPQLFTTAILKMEVSGREFISKPFTISSPPILNVGYDCGNKLLLHWTPQPGATGYTLYHLKNDSLTAFQQIADTLAEIDKSALASPYLAVSANGVGFSGLKSYTINYTTQGVSCYVRTFTGELSGETVLLNLGIGSTYNLKNVLWEKQVSSGRFTVLSKTAIIDGLLNYTATDQHPVFGPQFYRVTFETTGGLTIHSDLVKVNYLREADFVSFPNPVSDRLSVVSGDFELYTLEIYNLSGQKLIKEDGTGTKETDVSRLVPGVYLGVISRKGVILKRIKVIKVRN